jgi:hypothetical protein
MHISMMNGLVNMSRYKNIFIFRIYFIAFITVISFSTKRKSSSSSSLAILDRKGHEELIIIIIKSFLHIRKFHLMQS